MILNVTLAAMVVGVAMVAASFAVAAERPSGAGLVLWVDAANPESAKVGADGMITEWRDLSGQGNHLKAEVAPQLVQGGMHGKPVVRFGGKQSLVLGRAVREKAGSGTILVVWQRSGEQADGDKWQRIVSSRFDQEKPDNQAPNFCMTGDKSGEPKAVAAVIYDAEITDQPIGALAVGRTGQGNWQFLRGDIAEILVYDRAFLSEGEIQEVLGYLKAKWGAKVGREENGWTRIGGLGEVPKHVRQDLPLSDQQNAGKWVLDTQFTDEFDAPALDMKRWHLNPTAPGDWRGRQPALFAPENVYVKAGQMHLDFRKGDTPALEKHKGEGYAEYTSALVQSKELTGYGYYEARCRPMNSAGSSAFWFTETRLADNATEIDVFEIGGNAPGFEKKYNMNAHVWRTPQEKRHWAIGGVWNAPWRLADDYHVYGFEWNKDELIWYVDGVAVRKMKNTNWQFPMRVIFDSEAMWSWFGKVNDADLPSTFSIDYLRVWRKGGQ